MSLIQKPFGFGVAGGPYRAISTYWDGTCTAIKSGAFSGTGATSVCTQSFWIRFIGGDGSQQFMSEGLNSNSFNRGAATANWTCDFGQQASCTSSGTSFNVAYGWQHVIFTATGTGTGNACALYIDGVDQTYGANIGGGTLDFDIDNATNTICRRYYSAAVGVGDYEVCDLWKDSAYFDLSDSSNLEKFIKDGKPVDLGDDGSGPTGSSPVWYQSVREGESAADFMTNKGTGGDLTLTGTLSLGASSPSDD